MLEHQHYEYTIIKEEFRQSIWRERAETKRYVKERAQRLYNVVQ